LIFAGESKGKGILEVGVRRRKWEKEMKTVVLSHVRNTGEKKNIEMTIFIIF
jgi:hypothetical protein